MGKAIIIPDISFSSKNLGQVSFINNLLGLKITAQQNITVSFPSNMKYSDKKYPEWSKYTANTVLNISSGNSIIFTGNLTPTANGIGTFSISGNFTVSGNILALTGGESISAHVFKELFKNCTGLTNASELVLPDTVAEGCYEAMFKGCTAMTAGPVLPATELVSDCYKELFYGCSSLNHITIYSETQPDSTYTNSWVYGVAASGTILYPKSEVTYTEDGIHGVPEGWTEIDNSDYGAKYFTVESLEDSNIIKIAKAKTPPNISLSYSLDKGTTWTALTIGSGIDITTINTGDKIMFKGVNDTLACGYDTYYRFNASKNFKVYGNAMSLLWGDNFITNSEFATSTSFNLCGLFFDTTTVIDAGNLILPALTCADSCYNGMFRNSANLAVAPALPATVAAHDCYSSMFEGCINLVTAPDLHLTTLAQTCCKNMFCMDRNSKVTTPKMTKGPMLPATTYAPNAYQQMFMNNANITEVTCLLEGSNLSCANWLANTAASGTFKKSSNATWSTGGSGIPDGWTTQTYVES